MNEENTIATEMKPNLSFIFSGTFLMHRQNGNNNKKQKESEFVNLSSYGNRKLFNHTRKSFYRNLIQKIT